MPNVSESKTIPPRKKPNRLGTVKKMMADPAYSWATESFLRHSIFNADPKMGSNGAQIPGNGLTPAIIRIGRKVLIDLDEFDRWVEAHRMSPGEVEEASFDDEL